MQKRISVDDSTIHKANPVLKSEETKTNYWAMRTSRDSVEVREFLKNELLERRLRQGIQVL